jgi:hypothetical protein
MPGKKSKDTATSPRAASKGIEVPGFMSDPVPKGRPTRHSCSGDLTLELRYNL